MLPQRAQAVRSASRSALRDLRRNLAGAGGLVHGCRQERRCRRRGTQDQSPVHWSLCLEALAAEHRTTLRRLERNRRLDAARRTMRPRLRSRDAGRCRSRAGLHARAGTPTLARFAPFRIVFELFIEEEELFAGSEDKVATTVDAGQKTIHEVHGDSPITCR